jgi:hypothetical protein
MRLRTVIALLAVVALVSSGAALAQEGPKFTIGGTTYFKWLWGNQRDAGSVYNFTTVPGEGYGDNGQGSEIELLLDAKVSRYVEVKARLHSRFNQNEWTNFGGFGDPAGKPGGDPACVGGACGENDPRSNQYVKLRGVSITLTPGYKWIDTAVLGANDFGQFDPFTIGKIRYIDRDNGAGLLFQGSALDRQLRWDAVRISLPRLWAGPNYNTGNYTAADAAYGAQAKYTISPQFDLGGIFEWVNDIEVDNNDRNLDNGRNTRTRFRNSVVGVKAGIHPSPKIDVRAAYYHSTSESANDLAPANFFGLSGFSPVPAGAHKDWSGKVNVDLNDPFGVGLNFNLEGFRIGGEYVSMMAARRESDVLLTEGHDAAFGFPGPSNASFGVFSGNPTRIGYGGWSGATQQVATINVDNEFTDFDEPMAETVIGWQGVTFVPTWSRGALDLSGEYSYISYNTNWQAFGDNTQPVTSTVYPVMELDTGVGHNFRSAYAPFQDKKTQIAALKAKYVVDIGKGLEIYAKAKYIKETDNRLNNALYLPYKAGDCTTTGTLACAGVKNFYYGTNTTADIYGNPPVITVTNPLTGAKATGYQWKPFDSISDDDRDLKYYMFSLGTGYQLTNDLYGLLSYNYYNADLKDGNTAMQAYNLHEMASGKHKKNSIDLKLRYTLGGLSECGLEYQYNFGTFDPDFGGGFVTQYATDQISKDHNVPVNSPGFAGRFGGWNSLAERSFDQQRLKAYMKIGF